MVSTPGFLHLLKPEPLEPPPGRPVPYKLRPHDREPQVWAAVPLDLVDEPERFEMALRIREDGRVRLQPENSELEPIYAAHVQVIGKVIGVFRAL